LLFGRRPGPGIDASGDAGRCLFPYAQQILALHQQARAEVTGKKPALSGQLSLAASSIPGEHILPALLASFRGKYPHVQVRVSVADSLVVLDHVEHGKAHLGLVGRKNDSPHLEFQSIACDEMVLVVPSSHPWARRKRIALARLGSVPLILREVGSGSRWCLEQALTAAGRSLADLQIALELGSNEAIKEAVLQGMGLAILSSRAVQKELRTGELHALKLTGLDLKRDLFVVWDRRRVLPIPAKLFLDLLEAAPSASSEGH
jgi:DNA-binding transcriptional LysR family regulator